MNDNVLSPDSVAEWMGVSRRTALKLIRKVASHWMVSVMRNGKSIVEPRVLESELLRYLKEPHNHKQAVRMPLERAGKKVQFETLRSMRDIYNDHFSKSEPKKSAR